LNLSWLNLFTLDNVSKNLYTHSDSDNWAYALKCCCIALRKFLDCKKTKTQNCLWYNYIQYQTMSKNVNYHTNMFEVFISECNIYFISIEVFLSRNKPSHHYSWKFKWTYLTSSITLSGYCLNLVSIWTATSISVSLYNTCLGTMVSYCRFLYIISLC
jgi:hypothetical protein